MRVGVMGATGTAGTAVARELADRGARVVALGRRPAGVASAHRHLDVVSGDGLPAAFAGLDAVVDCLNGGRRPAAARPVLVDGLRRALAAASAAGVGHAVSLSIVGCERVPTGYYRVKAEQEGVVRAAPLPATVLRATQFHPLLDDALAASRPLGVIPAPRGVLQPVDPRDVAAAAADLVERGPGPDAAVAGPEILDIAGLAATWRDARASRRPILRLPAAGGVLRAVAAGALTDPDAPRGRRTWAEHLARRA